MSASTLEAVARDVLEHEVHRDEAWQDTSRGADAAMQVCPVSWLLPDLLQLIAERHDEPVHHFRPAIRTLIRERTAPYTCGAGMSLDETDEVVEHHVELLVRVLERVRVEALERGQWSEMGAAPEMFG